MNLAKDFGKLRETIWKFYLEILFDCHVLLAWPQLNGMPAFMQISHSVEKILDHCKRGSLYSRVNTKSELAAGSSRAPSIAPPQGAFGTLYW